MMRRLSDEMDRNIWQRVWRGDASSCASSGYQRTERSYGHFYRLIAVPEGANVDQAKAEFKSGILDVQVPARPSRNSARGGNSHRCVAWMMTPLKLAIATEYDIGASRCRQRQAQN